MKPLDALRMSLGVGREVYLRRRPFLLYLKPTARCDLRCASCNRWQEQGRREDELPLDELESLLARFRRGGCQILTLWGGEPTLRRDLPEILAAAKRLGYRTAMCTNANHMETRAPDLAPHLDLALCSLDGLGAVHDELRGVPGLFDRVVRGVRELTRHRSTRVRFWISVNRRNQGQLRELLQLAAELGISAELFPLSRIPGYNDELVLDGPALGDAFALLHELKREGLPVANPESSLRIMGSGEAFRCNFGRISIHVDHRGQVYSCEDAEGRPLHTWGDQRGFDPEAVFGSAEFDEVATRLEQCRHCRYPCVVQLSNNLTVSLARTFLTAL